MKRYILILTTAISFSFFTAQALASHKDDSGNKTTDKSVQKHDGHDHNDKDDKHDHQNGDDKDHEPQKGHKDDKRNDDDHKGHSHD